MTFHGVFPIDWTTLLRRREQFVFIFYCNYICVSAEQSPPENKSKDLLMCLLLNLELVYSWNRCYDFKSIFAEKVGKKLAFFAQTTAIFLQKVDHNIGFCEKRQLFRSPKIGKNRRKM
jgi:hypothetical protein